MNIAEFLKARIADDEAHAYRLSVSDRRPALALYATVNHPQRVIAECAAKRRIVGLYEAFGRSPEPGAAAGWGALGEALKDLASVYADHPDYQQEWELG